MLNVLMGASSALSLGIADFMASQSSERIGAPRALAGMLLVSTLVLSLVILFSDEAMGQLITSQLPGITFGIIHGITMAIALVLFFHAMAIGQITVVAPIIAAHPVFIIGFSYLTGGALIPVQMASVIAVLVGVGIVGACGQEVAHTHTAPKKLAPTRQVVIISLISSLLYAGAIIALQQAGQMLTELPVLWLGRSFGLLTIVFILLLKRQSPLPPSNRWWPFFILHGTLDSAGMLFILLGTSGEGGDTITAVVASTFPVITVLLAWIILKERMTWHQIVGAIAIFSGVAALAAIG